MIKKNILLTGASGTVGFEALLQLIDKKIYSITVFDKETKQSRLKLLPYKDKVTLIFWRYFHCKRLRKDQRHRLCYSFSSNNSASCR